jgi:hypothetical protein
MNMLCFICVVSFIFLSSGKRVSGYESHIAGQYRNRVAFVTFIDQKVAELFSISYHFSIFTIPTHEPHIAGQYRSRVALLLLLTKKLLKFFQYYSIFHSQYLIFHISGAQLRWNLIIFYPSLR